MKKQKNKEAFWRGVVYLLSFVFQIMMVIILVTFYYRETGDVFTSFVFASCGVIYLIIQIVLFDLIERFLLKIK